MKAPFPTSVWPAQAHTRAYLFRLASGAGWPVLVGLSACVCGVLMLAASWYLQHQAQLSLSASTRALAIVGRSPGSQLAATSIPSTGTSLQPPLETTQLDDLGHLFRLARQAGVAIGSVEYRSESSPTLPILIRTVNLRMTEDYPKLKSFVARLLEAMPHVSLQEIRIDRKDATALQGQAMLKLSFVYQADTRPTLALPGR